MSRTDQLSSGCHTSSSKFAPPTVMRAGTSKRVSGVIVWFSSALAMVMTLFVEPGSYGVVNSRLLSVGAAGRAGPNRSAPSTTAAARMSPLCTSAMSAIPPLALHRCHLGGQLLLHLVLQVPIERQHDVAAGDGGTELPLGRRDLATVGIALGVEPSGAPGQLAVEPVLDPATTGPLAVDEPDDRPGQVAVRHHTLRPGFEGDAGIVERTDRGLDLRAGLTLEHDVPGVGAGERPLELGFGLTQDRGETDRGRVRLRHRHRIDEDGRARHRECEVGAVAVDDRATRRLQLRAVQQLLARELCVVRAIRALETDELARDHHEDDQHRQQHHGESPTDVRRLRDRDEPGRRGARWPPGGRRPRRPHGTRGRSPTRRRGDPTRAGPAGPSRLALRRTSVGRRGHRVRRVVGTRSGSGGGGCGSRPCGRVPAPMRRRRG